MSKFTIMYLYVFACVNIRAVSDFIGLYKRNNEKSQNCVTFDQIIIVRSVVNGMASGLFQELIFLKVFFQQIKEDYVWRTNHTKYCSINYEIHVINFKNFLQKKV